MAAIYALAAPSPRSAVLGHGPCHVGPKLDPVTVLGSLAALAAIVFIVPGLTTIAGLLTIVAPVTFMAAWIAIGPQRFAYLGMQFGLAFYLALLGVILVTLCMDGYRQGKRRE